MTSERVHVVGCSPRSGTTLMFEILSACTNLAPIGGHEISVFERPGAASGPGPWVTKCPTDMPHVARLLRWDPMLHVVYMRRDPRDVVVSRHRKHPDAYWCDFDVFRHNEARLAACAPHPRLVVVDYETLVREPGAVERGISGAFPFLRVLHPFEEFDRHATAGAAATQALGGVRRVSASSVGSWRAHPARIARQLQDHPDMAPALIEMGYETDDGWTRALAGVAPDESPSVRAVHDPMAGRSRPRRVLHRIARRLGSLGREARYALAARTGN